MLYPTYLFISVLFINDPSKNINSKYLIKF